MGYKNVAVWGTGAYWRKYKDRITEYVKIKYLVDSNAEYVNEKNIAAADVMYITPENIKHFEIDLVLIAVINKKSCLEIENYLKENQINYDFIDYYIDSLQLKKVNYEGKKFEDVIKEPLKRVIFVQIPTSICNFKCNYCYLIQKGELSLSTEKERYPHRPEYIAKALSYERVGGRCYFDFTSFGETLLYKDLAELTELLLQQGHIVSITSNGTVTRAIDTLLDLPNELVKNLFFRFSYHHLELKNRNLTGVFFDNVRKVRKSEASFTVAMVACDEYAEYKNQIKEIFIREIGALPHLDFVRESRSDKFALMSERSIQEYMDFWNEFGSEKFEHRKYFFGRKISEFCSGGDKCAFVNIFSGDVAPCSQMKSFTDLYENIDKEIMFKAVGKNCPCDWCINSIMWANFGAIATEYQGPGYANIFNRVDKEGVCWIKPELYKILNTKIM